MMKKLAALSTSLLLFGTTGMAHATLTTIGTATYDGSAYKLIWDDDNNGNSVIWLDYTHGAAKWDEQNSWATGLGDDLSYNIDSAYTVSWDTGWRLGRTVDETASLGPNITNSEMGHLFYEELGNLGNKDTAGNDQAGYGLLNTGDFDNLINSRYWSSTEYALDTNRAWNFLMEYGSQAKFEKIFYSDCGLAVRSGQVSMAPVPEPATMLLFGSGLVCLLGIEQKRSGGTCLTFSGCLAAGR